MGPLVILVIGLHAALLAIPVRSARSDHAPGVGAQMHVRLLAAPLAQAAPVNAGAVDPASIAAAAPALQPPPRETSPPLAQELPTSTETTTRATAADVSPPAPAIGLVLPGGDRDADYFPRAMLSLAPTPVDPVVIDYPVIAKDSGHYTSELTLFIDETGRVARVRVDGPALPAALEEAARAAFVNAGFRPGQVQGRAVKSQIRVEVVFDNRPPSAALTQTPAPDRQRVSR